MIKKKITLRAGFIPYYKVDDVIYMMFMKPSDSKYGGSDFQLAKGHVDHGEDAQTAAMREANEELGLLSRNVKSIHLLGRFMGYTDIFYGEIKDKNDFISTTYETGETAWMTQDDFASTGRTLHRHVVEKLLKEIK